MNSLFTLNSIFCVRHDNMKMNVVSHIKSLVVKPIKQWRHLALSPVKILAGKTTSDFQQVWKKGTREIFGRQSTTNKKKSARFSRRFPNRQCRRWKDPMSLCRPYGRLSKALVVDLRRSSGHLRIDPLLQKLATDRVENSALWLMWFSYLLER